MPTDAAPSYLLKEPDGTFWVAQLGGFKVSRFDPATATLTEWPDTARRPTAFVRKADGTLWLPETNGTLTNFDPATGTFVYWRSTDTANPISSLTYPFLDADGSVWARDFLLGAPPPLRAGRLEGDALGRSPTSSPSPRRSSADRTAPSGSPSTARRQLARFDPGDRRAEDLRRRRLRRCPFDMKVYKDRIVYTEQQGGEVGVFDPRGVDAGATRRRSSRRRSR